MSFTGPYPYTPYAPPPPPPPPPALNDAALGPSFNEIAALQGDPANITQGELTQALTTENATVGPYGSPYGNPYSTPYTPMSYASLYDTGMRLGMDPTTASEFAYTHNGQNPTQVAYELMQGQPVENAGAFKASVTAEAGRSAYEYNTGAYHYGMPYYGSPYPPYSPMAFVPPPPPPPYTWGYNAWV